MVYDDVLDLCWLQDVSTSGERTWDDAVAWAEGLEFGDYDDWRLARMSDQQSIAPQEVVDCAGVTRQDCIDSGNELGYMFYYNLTPPGDTPPTDFGTDLSGDQGPFTGISAGIWSGTENSANSQSAWWFVFVNGDNSPGGKAGGFNAWAVRDGQCRAMPGAPAAPIPAVSAWGLGVLGLLLMLLARARLR
jgi:hypothetical protein